MFNINYLTMHNVQIHAGAIRLLLYGLYVFMDKIILPYTSTKHYNNLHFITCRRAFMGVI